MYVVKIDTILGTAAKIIDWLCANIHTEWQTIIDEDSRHHCSFVCKPKEYWRKFVYYQYHKHWHTSSSDISVAIQFSDKNDAMRFKIIFGGS